MVEESQLVFRRLIVFTVATDVVVTVLYAFWYINVTELWTEFGKGEEGGWLSNHSYAEVCGEKVCRAVIFWYFFTGRDTVSQFQGSSRATTCKVWKTFPELTGAFIKLFKLGEISTIDVATIEHFIVLLYDRTSLHFSLEMEMLSYTGELYYQHLLTETTYLPCCSMFAGQCYSYTYNHAAWLLKNYRPTW